MTSLPARVTALALVLALLGAAPRAQAKGSLSTLEDEFEKAIKRVTPATVVCLPRGVEERKIFGGSSGVIMSKKGLVLSDGDVGAYNERPKGKPLIKRTDDIEVRLPSLKGKGFQSFKAKVVKRDRKLDTSLLRIERPPSTLKYLRAGSSDELKVGDFAFVMGNSFGLATEAPPTLTAGVIASLVPKPPDEGGKWRHIYTSAAVNQGVNGGPIVNTRGQLIGTISNVVGFGGKKPTDPELVYAFLGKAVPVERLRAAYKDLPEFEELFPSRKSTARLPKESAALSLVFHQTARRTYAALVSIEVERGEQLSLAEPGRGGNLVQIPRYLGPVTGTLISQDGWVLSSLYNFANLATLNPRFAGWPAPANAKVKAGLEGIKGAQVFLPDGRKIKGRYVSYHEGIGVVLFKADLGGGGTDKPAEGSTTRATLRLLEPAQESAWKEGRFVLAVGNPFGANRLDDPLLTVGMLSKRHDESTQAPWAGQWQTDAGGTDANAGGAAVDLEGRLLGILTIWTATGHGRNSGIAFIAGWPQIEAVLEDMKKGRSFRRPLMGIEWGRDEKGRMTTTLAKIVKGSGAEKAGLRPGDRIVKVDGKVVTDTADVRRALADKWSGDTIQITVDRDGAEKTYDVVLGARD